MWHPSCDGAFAQGWILRANRWLNARKSVGTPATWKKSTACVAGALLAFLAAWLTPEMAWASGGGKDIEGLKHVVYVTLGLGLGYVMVHVVDRHWRQFGVLIAGGLEYIVLGVVLGWSGLITTDTVKSLGPFISFGVGSMGLLVGLSARKSRKPAPDTESTYSAFWSALLTLLSTAGLFYAWFYGSRFFFPGSVSAGTSSMSADTDAMTAVVVLGATAIVSASDVVIRTICDLRPRVGFMSRMLVNTARNSEVLGILAIAVVFCLVRIQTETNLPRDPTGWEWFSLNLALGCSLGLLFKMFLGREELDGEKLFVAALGVILFASGIAYYLQLSPIFVNFVIGFMLANHEAGAALRERLKTLEKPGYIVLFIFLGVAWELPSVAGWILAALYILGRLFGKTVGARLHYYYSHHQEKYSPGLGLALVGQGGLVAAMVLNYYQVYDTPLRPIVVNAVIVGVLINELIGRRAIRNLLVNAKELKLRDAGGGDETPWGVDEIPWETDTSKSDREKPSRSAPGGQSGHSAHGESVDHGIVSLTEEHEDQDESQEREEASDETLRGEHNLATRDSEVQHSEARHEEDGEDDSVNGLEAHPNPDVASESDASKDVDRPETPKRKSDATAGDERAREAKAEEEE